MDPAPDSAASVNIIWVELPAGVKRVICNFLAEYSGPNVIEEFLTLCGRAILTMDDKAQRAATRKRKRDDGDVTDPPRAPEKKPKVFEATPPLQSAGIDIVSPKIPFAWPAFRQSPIIFGRPTLSPTIAGKSPTVTPLSAATTSATAPNIPKTLPSFLPEPRSPPFVQFATAQPGKPVQQEPECDEHFTFADRRASHPEPAARTGTPHQHSPIAQNASSNRPPPVPSTKPSQGTHGWQPMPTIYKPPFTGVDMSSLKIPANSNVSVAMNFFHAPSVLHQNMDSGAPRKLKCIQCKELYMEAQNTAMECRRHTGRCVDVDDEKFDHHDVPVGAHQVWDCCRRTVQSRGCYPCNHCAG
ncbi:hypothetical protein INS49_012023 [Diaporthe citri]|uniref:uncharacterized protein n=1 Tax=Diaporthe citri TaxID=83186 RepID=UPI001C803EE2|nr:uncharacterized protein INS49_012023 [Diaporthe citri]KAG6360955.1 hypothetical protein INS49_012023 [Diaporthe citri]